ncbi:MAG: hypothetical protein WAU55_07535 [Dehalococcoidales bacterium]
MIEWILRQLERQPSTLFYEKELREKSVSEFEELKARKLLTCVQPDSVCEPYGYGQQNALIAINLDGHYYALDDDNNELLVLNRSDLIKYQFCLEVFAEEVAKANAFSGSPEKLHRRLYYAGERIIDGNKVALVLAFIDQEQTAEDLLLGIPGRLPAGFKLFYVVTPSYAVQSLKLKAGLEQQRILVAPLKDLGGFKIDLSLLAPKIPVMLPPEQEEESRLYGFKYKIPIQITGESSGKASNFIMVGDTRVSIGDASLALFLRLILGLYSEKSGEVSKSALSSEGYFRKDEDEYQKIGRLRDCFANIPNLNRLEFITDQNKSLKLSVHPSLVTLDLNRLLTHKDPVIRKLTEQISNVLNQANPDSNNKIACFAENSGD